MDSKTFDTLTRTIGAQRSRRAAVKSLAAGFMSLSIARSAAAQVSVERATCGQACTSSADCNAGLRCSRPNNRDGICVAIADSRDSCNRNINCERDFELCRNGRCVNQSTCSRCNVTDDCPAGDVCRDGSCGGCDRDRQCRAGEICRKGRCRRGGRRCRANRDCRRRERCRRKRCVSRK